MPPLICGSPVILDQSFPRDEHELSAVVDTLGQIGRQIENDQIHLILTEELANFVLEFEWKNRGDSYPILMEIHSLLNQWFLQSHERLVRFDLSDVNDYQPHPIPEGCSSVGLVDFWADEVGRLLALHDSCCPSNLYFIGIACEQAYSGSAPRLYCNPNVERCFPLVGPNEISRLLIDAYDWEVESDVQRQRVSVDKALRNYKAIGAIRIERPSSGSHYKMKFRKGRSWVVDRNVDPIPDEFLSQLVTITRYPLPVIKIALITGNLPRKILRFSITINTSGNIGV